MFSRNVEYRVPICESVGIINIIILFMVRETPPSPNFYFVFIWQKIMPNNKLEHPPRKILNSPLDVLNQGR